MVYSYRKMDRARPTLARRESMRAETADCLRPLPISSCGGGSNGLGTLFRRRRIPRDNL